MTDETMLEEEGEFSGGIVKKFLYVNRRAPYGSIYALESLEVVLIGAAFEQDVSLLFLDDGVFQLKKGQDTAASDMKNFSPTYRALEMYDVEKLYADKQSLEQRGLTEDDLIVPVEILSSEEIKDLMAQQDVVLSF